MADNLVKLEQDGPIALVTLNRPEAMNALPRNLRAQLCDIMSILDANDEIRAVILTGAGERAFCAGLDLTELGTEAEALRAATAQEPEYNPVKAVELCRKPIIAAINGFAITGGFELALACDIRIASSNARFADTHARVGVMPGWGLSQKLPRIIGISRAKELSLTGNFLDAATAERWGLVNYCVPPAELIPLAERLAADIASIDPEFINDDKALIDDGYHTTLDDGLRIEHRVSSSRNADLGPEQVEGRRAAVQARGRAQ